MISLNRIFSFSCIIFMFIVTCSKVFSQTTGFPDSQKFGASSKDVHCQTKELVKKNPDDADKQLIYLLEMEDYFSREGNVKNSHVLKGVKWGACDDSSSEKVCIFDPSDRCQLPRTRATITYSFFPDGAKIEHYIKGNSPKIEYGPDVNVDINKHGLHGYKLNFKSIVRRAFKDWDNCSGITFQEIDNPSLHADIKIGAYKLPINPASGVGVLHGLSYPPPPATGLATYTGYIYLNTSLTFRTSKDNIFHQIYLIALHEIGHVIGLEHNDYEESIMTSNSEKLFSKKRLSYYDYNNTEKLYYHNSPEEECPSFTEYAEMKIRERDMMILNNEF